MHWLTTLALLATSCSTPPQTSSRTPEHSPDCMVIGEGEVVVLAGQEHLKPRTVFLTASSFDNDRYTFCFVPEDMHSPDYNREISLRVGKNPPRARAWHSAEGEPLGHFGFQELTEPEAKLVARRFGVSIARLEARPFKLQPSFTLDKQEYAPGKPVQLRLRVENVGERRLSAHFGGWQRGANRHGRFTFTIVKDGKLVPDIGMTINFGGLSAATAIQPGEHFEEQVQLDQWCAFDSQGAYEVDAVYEMHVTETPLDFQGGKPCLALADNLIDQLRGHVQVIVK
ncbi:MAG TPA: hypothetical protein VK843_13985 [Planctomycetota bacterium]|nr:hypothetical protein [Planctomycetota bacterium]